MAKTFVANVCEIPNSTTVPELHSANYDPSDPSGMGLAAPLGSVCLRTDVGTTYFKVNSTLTGWVPLPPGTPGLATIASTGSASDLASGTVPAARMPALTGDITSSSGNTVTQIGAGRVTNAMLRPSGSNSVIGRAANSVGSAADIAATADGQLLQRSGGTIAFAPRPQSSFYDTILAASFTLGNFRQYDDIDLALGMNTYVVANFGGTAGCKLTGFKNGSDGKILTIYRTDVFPNLESFSNATGSALANQLLLPNVTFMEFYSQHAVTFRYDGALQRWLSLSDNHGT